MRTGHLVLLQGQALHVRWCFMWNCVVPPPTTTTTHPHPSPSNKRGQDGCPSPAHPHPSPLTKRGVDILLQIQDARGCMLVYQKQAKLDMQGSVFIVCRHRHERSPLRTDMVHPKLPRTCSCVTSVCKACCMMALYMPRVYIRRHPDNKLSQTWLCDMYDTLDSQPCHTHSLGSSLAQSST